MKIWVQSSANLGVDSAWVDYEKSLRRHLQKVARPGTEIDLHGTKQFSAGVNVHWYDRHFHAIQIMEAAIQAEREGYDAFVQTGALDYGFNEIREAVKIPVVFPVEAALHVATLLAPRFAFLTMNLAFLEYLLEKAKAYGFQDHLAPSGCVDIHYRKLQLAFKNPGPVLEILASTAKQIGQQGANILICAGNPVTMFLVEQGLTEIGGVPFLDSIGIVVKVTEMMVDLHQLGITRKGMGIYAPMPAEELKSARKIYGLEK